MTRESSLFQTHWKPNATRNRRVDRERIIALHPERLFSLRGDLDRIDREWDKAIVRLQIHVEPGTRQS